MKKYIYILYLLSLGFVPAGLVGQIVTTGNAIPDPVQCGRYQLTAATGNQKGGIYNSTPIDLTNNFDLKFTVNFGSNDFGGEGMAFVLQAAGTWASDGVGKWGLGVQNNSNAPNTIHVEFDTRYSHIECACNNNDNGVDHASLFKNGSITHSNTPWTSGGKDYMLGIHRLIGGLSNIEDGMDHQVQITYNATSKIFNVIVDGYPTIDNFDFSTTPSGSLAGEIGANSALWGWTASTPQANSISNKQYVGIANDNTIDYSLVNCQNTVMDFNAITFSFNSIVNYT
ncbi:MAG: hypothetical protein KDC84_15655, partial [Crocinitomicaceae bacterium]|nr:hypothetical protein [Crocinitomicaceae bacterium]